MNAILDYKINEIIRYLNKKPNIIKKQYDNVKLIYIINDMFKLTFTIYEDYMESDIYYIGTIKGVNCHELRTLNYCIDESIWYINKTVKEYTM